MATDPVAAFREAATEGGELHELVDRLLVLRRERDAADAALDEAKRKYSTAETAVVAAMSATGLSSLRRDDGVTVTCATYSHYRTTSLTAVLPWIDAHGYGDMAHRTIPWQRYEAFCRELAADGAELPPGTVAYEQQRLQVRGVKGGDAGEDSGVDN